LNGWFSLTSISYVFKKLSLIIDYTHYTYLYISDKIKKHGGEIGSIWLELLHFVYFEVNWQIRECLFYFCKFLRKKIYKKSYLPELIKLRIKVWEFDFNSGKKPTYNVLNAAILKGAILSYFLHSYWLAKIWYLHTCLFTQNIFVLFFKRKKKSTVDGGP